MDEKWATDRRKERQTKRLKHVTDFKDEWKGKEWRDGKMGEGTERKKKRGRKWTRREE